METPQRNTLGKAEKLKRRKQIDALFAKGKSFAAYPIKVMYSIGTAEAGVDDVAAVQIGVTASKRNFKKAVHRNRIKRLLREAYRIHKHDVLRVANLQQKELRVFFIYIDKTLPTFSLVEERMTFCLKRLVKILEEPGR